MEIICQGKNKKESPGCCNLVIAKEGESKSKVNLPVEALKSMYRTT